MQLHCVYYFGFLVRLIAKSSKLNPDLIICNSYQLEALEMIGTAKLLVDDFNESSPGMMFIEMASYVGDVLSYYVDNQFRESLLHAAEEKKNIFKNSKF